jgi:diguanylate cyclase (GGDEF)-like protein
MMAYDLLADEAARPERLAAPEPFDLCDLLPPVLAGSLGAGTLIVHPLESDYGELGYLLLDQGGADPQVGEALRMDLGRAIETVRGTSQLRARTRQLEAEVASRRAAWEALVHQAHHDPLTGLANRTAFLVGADTAIAGSGGAATLVLVDLHRFKDINDALGHDVGDAVLCEVAGRLIRLLGTGALLGRLAGDEFAVLVPGMAKPRDAVALGNTIVSELRERADVGGVHVEIDGRVGVALAPDHARDSGTLLRMADIALHGGGGDGRCGVALFDPAQQERVSRRLALFGELRQALSEHELVVHYQPIVTLARGEVTGVEALVRWRHPERGLLLPGEFIDVAEQTGLIDPLTSYVLDQALRDCRGWREDGTALKVAVNLSAKRLTDAELPGEVDRLLGRHQLPPSSLVLEITESAVISDPDRALSVLGGLRRLGTELSVDDFGTGQASLTYLTRLPVSGLKIDRSFVQPMESDAATRTIVRSILHLAGDLGLDVVAEGVESDAAYQSLGAFGCDQAQGFWLARPAPAERVPGLVRDLRTRLAEPASHQGGIAAVGPALPRPRTPAVEPAQEV